MKKIIAIFSVVLTSFVGISRDGYSADACRPQSCTGGNEMVNILYGGANNAGLCWGCEEGDDDHECDDPAVVGQVDVDGYIKRVYVCDHSSFIGVSTGNSWNEITASSWCLATDIKPASFAHGTNYKCGYSLDNATLVYDNSTKYASLPDGGTSCQMCKCDPGFTASTDHKSCISAPIESDCSDSGGYWNGSKCLCGTADRAGKDDKGDGQTYDVPEQKCKCSDSTYSWDDAEGKCIAPDAADIAACSDSGGNWENGECKCNEKELTQRLPDKKVCVRNDAYYNCEAYTSGGDWISGRCQCDSGKGLAGPNSAGVCYCSDSSKIYDSGIGQCTDSAETVCKNTGGRWNSGTSKCDCNISSKNIKEKDGSSPVRCECINDDYEWKTGVENKDGCVLNNAAKDRINTYNDLKRECEKWSGTFSPENYEDDRDPNNWECACPTANAGVKQSGTVNCQCDIDNGYMREEVNSQYFCKQSTCAELEDLCKNATDEANNTGVTEIKRQGVVHGREVCYCKCKDSNKFYDKGQNKCIVAENSMVELCRLYGAIVGKNGECVCELTGRPPEKGKICPTSSGSASGGGGASSVATVSAQQIEQANQKVSDAYNDLNSISNGFGRSHWKTASGNFNGARLASDSIAGVVLGTVGGVVTSNVIKKNQVKGGFESLQCTVGGQMVADFGDQFQVGIR